MTKAPAAVGDTAKHGVCLIGFANSREDSPWDRPNTDFVGLNELWGWYEPLMVTRAAEGKAAPPWAAWFELHPDWAIGATKREGFDNAAHWAWLQKQQPGRPIFMQAQRPEVPASVCFPLNSLYERFKARVPALQNRAMYLTSSIGMMLMWAIAEGRDEQFVPDGSGKHYDWIGLYGIDLAGDTEYVWQRPNAEFFAGFAAALGIEVEIAKGSALLRGECVYGYEDPPELDGPLNAEFLRQQIENLKGEMAKADAEIARQQAIRNTVHGALQAQQSNMRMVTEFVKRGITGDNLYNGKGKREIMTVDKVV